VSSFARFRSELEQRTGACCHLSDEQAGLLWAHYELLVRWNQKIGLTTVIELEEAVERHYAESLFMASRIAGSGGRACDVGSGAGFPGYPLAVLKPDLFVTLIESNRRKCAFLREACGQLPNVRVFAGRAEEFREDCDWVVSRAVKPEDVLRLAALRSKHLALLCGRQDALLLANSPHLAEVRVEGLPWGRDRVLLIAKVSRGTDLRP
jgi:16S rRNA (guanine527-N7)-methyltransferase